MRIYCNALSIREIGDWRRNSGANASGAYVGNLSYGYRISADGEHVEVEPSEQAALAQIRSLRQQGRSLRAIAAALNGQALRTRRGTGWRHDHIVRIISSESSSGSKRQ